MNNFCAIDGSATPTKFCLCQDRVTILCENCVGPHEKQLYGDIHDYHPISHIDVLYNLGLEGFRLTKTNIMNGTSFVRKLEEEELRQYEEAKRKLQETTKMYQDWLDYMHNCFKGLVAKFNQEKLLPLTSTGYQLSTFSNSVFGLGAPNFQIKPSLIETKPLTQFERDVSDLQTRLSQSCGRMQDFEEYYISAIQAGISSYVTPAAPTMSYLTSPATVSDSFRYATYAPPSPMASTYSSGSTPSVSPGSSLFLPFSRGQVLAKWMVDSSRLETVQLSRSLDLTNVVISVVLPDGTVFYCGGRENQSHQAVLVNPTSGLVSPLPDMQQGRFNSGVAYIDGVVYVFGGFVSGAESNRVICEKFVFQQNQWVELRNRMGNSRFQFTPFAYGRTIYIAGGFGGTKTVEAFDIPTEVFSTLPFVLPETFATTCLVYNNELIVLQNHKLFRWNVNSRTGDFQCQSVSAVLRESNVSVQIKGTKAYFSVENKEETCEARVLDLQNWSISLLKSWKVWWQNGRVPNFSET